jgi:hypothetical protein
MFLFATFGDALSEESCLTGNCTGNEAQVVKAIDSFHNSWHALNEREMFGTICNTTIKGDFYESKWLWQGRFWCPSLSAIGGFSKTQKSRDNAIKHATDDYIRKGKQLGFLTENRVRDSFDIKSNSIFPSINLESSKLHMHNAFNENQHVTPSPCVYIPHFQKEFHSIRNLFLYVH